MSNGLIHVRKKHAYSNISCGERLSIIIVKKWATERMRVKHINNNIHERMLSTSEHVDCISLMV